MCWGQGSPRPGTGVADLAQAETKGDALCLGDIPKAEGGSSQ